MSTLVQYDEVLRECTELTHEMLDFRECLSIQVKKDLFSFKYGSPITVSKIVNPRDSVRIRKFPMTPAKTDRVYFSVSKYQDRSCLLTGGAAKDKTGKWRPHNSLLCYDA
mmetsp:Transcript_22183/g.29670  ORF Transcript_22183/g.29670 Transcript_22183/m.29670 type:complete len:110 (+) Transcript_22183:853-1182(+)